MGRTIIASLAAAVAFTATPAVAEAPEVPRVQKWMVTPCQSEDSVGCYWDAKRMGNGEGRSFYTFRLGKSECVRYWNRTYGRKHDLCRPISKGGL